jgi:hypothetical protein
MNTTPNAPPRRGNPNLALAPRCGALTRAGSSCRAPAMRGKLRCRMHGGRSTGPRTEEGLARLRKARTIHGHFSAEARARDRRMLTSLRRWRVERDALRYLGLLPPGLTGLPPWTTRLSRAQDRAAMRAEAEALAPWKRAIDAAKVARRQATSPPRPHAPEPEPAAAGMLRASAPGPHAPEPPQATTGMPRAPAPGPHAPEARPAAAGKSRASAPRPHVPEGLLATTSLSPWPLVPPRISAGLAPASASATMPATAPVPPPAPVPCPVVLPPGAASAAPARNPAWPAAHSP